jgi:hypothetical protein
MRRLAYWARQLFRALQITAWIGLALWGDDTDARTVEAHV